MCDSKDRWDGRPNVDAMRGQSRFLSNRLCIGARMTDCALIMSCHQKLAQPRFSFGIKSLGSVKCIQRRSANGFHTTRHTLARASFSNNERGCHLWFIQSRLHITEDMRGTQNVVNSGSPRDADSKGSLQKPQYDGFIRDKAQPTFDEVASSRPARARKLFKCLSERK